MEWTREKTLALIQEYRKRRGLWDMTHDDYRKKEIKQKLLVAVSDTLGGISIAEIEKKFHTLRTQYHREINRMKRKEPYNSKWFGFKYLEFLSSPKACRSNKGRIKTEITEEGTVTTKYIIHEALSNTVNEINVSARNANSNDNDEYLTIPRVGSAATLRTHELEKLIEETTKDVEDTEDSKHKMTIKEISVPLEHRSHHEYTTGQLQISDVNNEQSEIQQFQEVDANGVETINLHSNSHEELTYQTATSTVPLASTIGVSVSATCDVSSNTTTVHTIPARIIKIQKRDASHESNQYYENTQVHHDEHHDEHHQLQHATHQIHTASANSITAPKRIYYDANPGHHTSTILATASNSSQSNNNLTLHNTASPSSPNASPSNKFQIRNDLTSISTTMPSIAPPTRDEFSTYGEYVGNEIRGIKSREILISLKHKINTALFEANMAELQK